MMKATATTAFAIVGLMYIFQEHSIDIKKSNAVIETYKKQQNILESNLTTLIKKEDMLENKNFQLLSEFEKANLSHKAKLKNFNQLLTQKDEQIKEENEKNSKLLIEAKEKTEKIQSQYQAKTKEIETLQKEKDNLEENLTTQIKNIELLSEDKTKTEKRIAQLLTVDRIKTFDDILNRQESLEANLTAEIEVENQLKEKNQNLKAIIDKMLNIAEDATQKATVEHDKDMEEYQSLLSRYKSLEDNLSIEIEKENSLKEEKSQLQLEIEEEREKELALESKLAEEIAKENILKEKLTEEIAKEDALKSELNTTISENHHLVKKDKKIELEMSELLFISKDSREKAQREHESKIKELEQQLATEIEKEQNLETNLTAEIEKENLLKEKNGELEAKIIEQIENAKEDKANALAESQNKIDELEATLKKELETKSNLESNLSAEVEREKVLLEEKSLLEAKITEQIALSDEVAKKAELEHEAKVKELQDRLSSEIEKEKLLESNLTAELEKEKVLTTEKEGLESEIAKLLTLIETKKGEIATQKESQTANLTKIEELTKERDELEKLAKERATQISKERNATKTALTEVQKIKDEMQNLLKEIANKKKAEEERVLKEKQEAKEKLLEAFKLTHVEFEVNSMNLTKKSKELLNDTAEVIKKYPNFSYNIQGHTDSRGNEAFNIKLSGQRAEQVKKYLTTRGIREDILSTEGIGSAQPIADNKTAEGRIINRRVVFEIVKE